MAHTFAELEALRKKIDRERIELDERERALSKVEQMLREEMGEGLMELPQLPIVAPIPDATSFSDAVRIAITAHGNSEFAVHDIENYLATHGFELPNDPRSRIAMVFQQLREKKVITLISQGSGRKPSIYRGKK